MVLVFELSCFDGTVVEVLVDVNGIVGVIVDVKLVEKIEESVGEEGGPADAIMVVVVSATPRKQKLLHITRISEWDVCTDCLPDVLMKVEKFGVEDIVDAEGIDDIAAVDVELVEDVDDIADVDWLAPLLVVALNPKN